MRRLPLLPSATPTVVYDRPLTRGDCEPGGALFQRPCPYASCRYHLSEPTPTRINSAARDTSQTCALDVAATGEHLPEEIGGYFGVSRERARQIGEIALAKAKHIATRLGMDLSLIVDRPQHALDTGVYDRWSPPRKGLSAYRKNWTARHKRGSR